jgi:hypothetical protein
VGDERASDFGSWKQHRGPRPIHEDFERAERSYELIEHLSLPAQRRGERRVRADSGDRWRRGPSNACGSWRRSTSTISFALLSGGRVRRLGSSPSDHRIGS